MRVRWGSAADPHGPCWHEGTAVASRGPFEYIGFITFEAFSILCALKSIYQCWVEGPWGSVRLLHLSCIREKDKIFMHKRKFSYYSTIFAPGNSHGPSRTLSRTLAVAVVKLCYLLETICPCYSEGPRRDRSIPNLSPILTRKLTNFILNIYFCR